MNSNSSISYTTLPISSNQHESLPPGSQSVYCGRKVAYLCTSSCFAFMAVATLAMMIFSTALVSSCINDSECPNFCDDYESDLANKNCTDRMQIINPKSPVFACCNHNSDVKVAGDLVFTIVAGLFFVVLSHNTLVYFRKACTPETQRSLENLVEIEVV